MVAQRLKKKNYFKHNHDVIAFAAPKEKLDLLNKRQRKQLSAWIFLACLWSSSIAAQQSFEDWKIEFRSEALEYGISAKTLDDILPGIKQDRRVVKADRNQAEFNNTYARYLKRVSPWRIKKGRALLRSEHADMINQVAQAHNVQARFVIAILGIETNYGTVELTHSVFDVVATLAYDGRRAVQFRGELMAALEIVDKGYASLQMLSSSWAGALGFPQFNPSNYLSLAVDEDRDGKRDIWQMGPDLIGSVANYLEYTDWQDDQTWGREVRLPPGGETSLQGEQSEGLTPVRECKKYKTLGIWRSLPEWQKRGVRTKWGASLPTRPLAAALVIGDEGDNRGYLVYRNFCSLLRYNPSFRYALGVSLLSDRIGN